MQTFFFPSQLHIANQEGNFSVSNFQNNNNQIVICLGQLPDRRNEYPKRCSLQDMNPQLLLALEMILLLAVAVL